MERIDDFNAEKAIELSTKTDVFELNFLLEEIRKAAENGNRKYSVDKSLKPNTLEKLKEKGFSVKPMSSIARQKDSVYYLITW